MCSNVRVDVDATLNAWNSLVIDNMRFSYAGGLELKADPVIGFHFNPVTGPASTEHEATYHFVNEDSVESITLRDLEFVSDWIGIQSPISGSADSAR